MSRFTFLTVFLNFTLKIFYICNNPSYVPAAKVTVIQRTDTDVCSERP